MNPELLTRLRLAGFGSNFGYGLSPGFRFQRCSCLKIYAYFSNAPEPGTRRLWTQPT